MGSTALHSSYSFARRAVDPLSKAETSSPMSRWTLEGARFSLPFFEQLQSERNVFSDVAAFVPAELSVNSAQQ
jgi:hypothetical protein